MSFTFRLVSVGSLEQAFGCKSTKSFLEFAAEILTQSCWIQKTKDRALKELSNGLYKDGIRLEFPKLLSFYDFFSLILSLSRVNVDFHKLKWMSGNEIASAQNCMNATRPVWTHVEF